MVHPVHHPTPRGGVVYGVYPATGPYPPLLVVQEWASGLRVARRAQGGWEAGKQGSREAGKQESGIRKQG